MLSSACKGPVGRQGIHAQKAINQPKLADIGSASPYSRITVNNNAQDYMHLVLTVLSESLLPHSQTGKYVAGSVYTVKN